MTARQPPRIDANTAAMAKSAKDIRSPMALCPLMGQKLQLLPLRYGLVEHLDLSSELSMPFKLRSQPLGIRLLRDGYLYIIDSNTGYLHEYAIAQGQISKLLWNSQEVASDIRTASVGEPHLVFTRRHTLYASYSEIQWTAAKCAQVLKNNAERERLMQRIEPARACPLNGGSGLLSKFQAERWLAEVAPDTPPAEALPEGANPEEHRPYHWEHEPLFQETAIEALTSKVLGPYQDDYLFLVLHDDMGVMRDLASAQLKVADWIEHWSADDEHQRQYLTGAYIQSLYEVNSPRLDALSSTDSRIKVLKDGTSPEEQALIYEHLRLRRESGGPSYYDDIEFWRKSPNPGVRAWFTMYDTLGEARWQQHRQAIEQLERQSKEALHGEKFFQRGIDDLVNRQDMEAFVGQQQALLRHWHQRLENVREDRLAMVTGGYFHRAAWYYSFQVDTQIKHRLETEFVCVAALCSNRAATEKLAAYLENNPLTVVPGLETLTLADQLDLAKKLTDLSDVLIKVATAPDTLAGVDALANQFSSLINARLPDFADLNARFSGLQSLLDGAYSPAHQLRAADQLDRAHHEFKRQQPIDPNSFIRSLGMSARLQLLREFSRSGLTLRASSAYEIQTFYQTRDAALALRGQLKAIYKLRHQEMSRQTYGLIEPGSELAYNERIYQLRARLVPLEDRLSQALTVGSGSGSPGQIGTVVDGMAPQLRDEMHRTVRDFRATGTFGQPLVSALKSGGDGIALLLFVFQGQKFVEALSSFTKNSDVSYSDFGAVAESFIGAAAAGFAAVQGVSVTILQAHIEQMDSAAGKLNSMSRLGRWTGIAGFNSFIFGGMAAAIDLGKHSKQWGNALAKGNYQGLAATSLQLAGDGILVGTNTWGAIHTASIISGILKQPSELRALAWAEASPRLLSIGAKANLVGLIGTALQLTGEGFFNYFNLDELQKWLQASAWGKHDLQRSLPEDWSALAKVVQQPTCELVREGKSTYLKLLLPGVRTREMDRRQLQLLVYQQTRDRYIPRPYSRTPPPVYWKECSAAWAAEAVVVSQDEEALTLHLPIGEFLQTSDFALSINIGYQLEAERELIHRTCFVLRDLRINRTRGHSLPAMGRFTLDPVEALPKGTGKAPYWRFTRDEMATGDV